jgi:hypothetical protein
MRKSLVKLLAAALFFGATYGGTIVRGYERFCEEEQAWCGASDGEFNLPGNCDGYGVCEFTCHWSSTGVTDYGACHI